MIHTHDIEITSLLLAIAAATPTGTVRWFLPWRKHSEVLLTTLPPTEEQLALLHIERLKELEHIYDPVIAITTVIPPVREGCVTLSKQKGLERQID